MADSGPGEITLNVATEEAMPNEMVADILEQEEEQKISTMTQRQSNGFGRKVMRELMEMKSWDDMLFLRNQKTRNLMNMLHSSSVADDIQFHGNEKMRELMEKQFSSSSVDDGMPFWDNMVRIMYPVLYEAACDKNTDADRFVDVLEQVCTQKKVDLATILNDHVSPTGDSLLHVAVERGSEQVVRLISFHYPKLMYKTNMKGDTPLHVAARAKNVVAIKHILNMDKHFMTSEEEEAESSVDKVELIMLRNNYGRTALHEAVLSMDYVVVLFLLLSHKKSDRTMYWTWNQYHDCNSPMYLAVMIKTEDIVDLLLRLIPIPTGKAISMGDSPLHAAMSERNEDLMKMILDTRKELLYQRDEQNNTPLHYAAYAGYVEGVCLMLEKSPMVAFQRNSDGNLPIHLACGERKVEVVKKLLEIKEWPDNAGLLLNNKGQNVLHIAAMRGAENVTKYLLKHPQIHNGIVVNERDVNGDTPLHLASRKFRLWTLFLLSRDKMINVNFVNNQGFTAQDVVLMQSKIPMTRQELLAYVILRGAGVPEKANKLGIPRKRSINKEWNVKDIANTLMLVAILIATVTFAAGFTVPGGSYSSDGSITKERGLAHLSDQTLFKIFMAFNTVAMYSSTIGSVILLAVPVVDLRFAGGIFRFAAPFVSAALLAMPIAFLAATRLIVSNNTLLADVISAVGLVSISFIIALVILVFFPLGIRLPVFRQTGDAFIWIVMVLFYGRFDAWTRISPGNLTNLMQDIISNEAFTMDEIAFTN